MDKLREEDFKDFYKSQNATNVIFNSRGIAADVEFTSKEDLIKAIDATPTRINGEEFFIRSSYLKGRGDFRGGRGDGGGRPRGSYRGR